MSQKWGSAAVCSATARCSGWAERLSAAAGKALLAAVVGVGLLGTAPAQAFMSASANMPTMQREELPPQGKDVLAKIESGTPFRHEKDGSVFGNRERLLPRQTRGYYREYTVRTPGVKNRGARRIVCGGEVPRTPDACYYTEDHYASFRRIAK